MAASASLNSRFACGRTSIDLHKKAVTRFSASESEADRLAHVGESPIAAGINPKELAAMTVVTRAILNLHETITRN